MLRPYGKFDCSAIGGGRRTPSETYGSTGLGFTLRAAQVDPIIIAKYL